MSSNIYFAHVGLELDPTSSSTTPAASASAIRWPSARRVVPWRCAQLRDRPGRRRLRPVQRRRRAGVGCVRTGLGAGHAGADGPRCRAIAGDGVMPVPWSCATSAARRGHGDGRRGAPGLRPWAARAWWEPGRGRHACGDGRRRERGPRPAVRRTGRHPDVRDRRPCRRRQDRHRPARRRAGAALVVHRLRAGRGRSDAGRSRSRSSSRAVGRARAAPRRSRAR